MKYLHSLRAMMTKSPSVFMAITAVAAVVSITPTTGVAGEVITGVIEGQYVCHDGANLGTAVGLGLSLPTDRKIFATASLKGYYAATNCINLEEYAPKHLSRGSIVRVWFHDYFHFGHWQPCQGFTIRYVRDENRIWVQNGGSTTWNITCVAKYSL